MNNFIFYLKISKSYLLGLITLIIISILVYKISSSNNNCYKKSYFYKAHFSNVEGISNRTPIMLFGYKVGQVKKVYLDIEYNPIVILAIDKKVSIPDDSTINIKENGVMGNKLLQLNLGIDDTILPNHSTIMFTNNGINFLELLNMIISYISSIKNNTK